MLLFVVINEDSVKIALAPLEFILSIAASLMLIVVLMLVPATIFGSGSFLGFGDPTVCLTAPQSAVGGMDAPERRNDADIRGLHRSVSSTADTYQLCENSPSASQRVWWWLAHVPDFLYALVFLLISWSLTRTARRRGLFSPHLALAVGRLGLFVLLGAVAVALLRAVADWRLVTSMVAGPSDAYDEIFTFFRLSWATLFAGFGLLTVGRVMARTVPMQQQIDATI